MQSSISFLHNEPIQKTFPAGAIVFSEGEVGDEMYCVLEGELEILIEGEVVEIVGVDGIVGEMTLIDNSPRSATVRAKTDCRLAVVTQKRFMTLIQQTPYFSIQVMTTLAQRLRRCSHHHHAD